jgi:hypothetical protein
MHLRKECQCRLLYDWMIFKLSNGLPVAVIRHPTTEILTTASLCSAKDI